MQLDDNLPNPNPPKNQPKTTEPKTTKQIKNVSEMFSSSSADFARRVNLSDLSMLNVC